MNFEERVDCLDCGLKFEATEIMYGTLDAYGPLDVACCPKCGGDNLLIYMPREDKGDD